MSAPPTPGWYQDPSGAHHRRYWDGAAWTDDVFDGGADAADDPGFAHFLRFAGVYAALAVACVFIVGYVWLMLILNRVGYRKRDFLMTLIPVYGAVVIVTAVWRYTARSAYWSPHPGRVSKPLAQPWQRGLSILGGVLFAVVTYVVVMEAVTSSGDEMTDAEWREDFVDFWSNEGGKDPAVARCAAPRVEKGIPYDSKSDVAQAIEAAFALCEAELKAP